MGGDPFKLPGEHQIGLLGAVALRFVRLAPLIPFDIEDHEVSAGQVVGQPRAGAVGRKRIHFKKIGRRREAREQVVEEGVDLVRPAEVRRTDKKALPVPANPFRIRNDFREVGGEGLRTNREPAPRVLNSRSLQTLGLQTPHQRHTHGI